MTRIARWIAAVALASAGCSGHLSREECGEAVDHMIEIFTAPDAESPGKDLTDAVEKWRTSLKGDSPSKSFLIDQCQKTMTGAHASCVRDAKDEKSLASCFAG